MKKHIHHFYSRYKVHLLCWAVFIAYETSVVSALSGNYSSFWDYFIHYAINITLFYIHAKLVLPFELQKGNLRFWLIPLLVAGEILVFISTTHVLEVIATQYFQVEMMRPVSFDYQYIVRAAWRAIYFLGFATGYYYLEKFLKDRKRAEEAEKQHFLHIIEKQNLQHDLIKSQNAFLKAQINPHFLFNTLSFVYNSVRKTSAQAADTILSLSQMMRYSLESSETGPESNLLEEIEHVEHLIHIHQIRHNHQLQVQLSYGQNLEGIKFIPLVLITLVENIFKHGDLTRRGQPACISITFDSEVLHITTSNLMNSQQIAGHRIGLDNIHRRLDYAYKEQAFFKAYSDEKGYFHTMVQVSYSPVTRLVQLANQIN